MMPKNLKNNPEAFAAWKAKRALYANVRYHALKTNPEYVEKKRASNRKTWRKRYPKLREDVEAYRAKQREYYHRRGKFIRMEKRREARRAAVSLGKTQQDQI